MEKASTRVGTTALVTALLFVGGALEGIPRIESELERSSIDMANRLGIGGVRADFSGQDARLSCNDLLTPVQRSDLTRAIKTIRGVAVVKYAPSCGGSSVGEGADPVTTRPPSTPIPGTVINALPSSTGEGSTTSIDATTSAAPTTGATSTTEAPITSTPPVATADPVVEVVFADGALSLVGAVASDDQRNSLVGAIGDVVDPQNVTDELDVTAESAVPDPVVEGIGALAAAMVGSLSTGVAGWDGSALYVRGQYRTDESKASLEQLAASYSATTDLVARPAGAECDVQALAERLNTLVAENPIEFVSEQSTIRAESQPTIDRVAVIADGCSDIVVTIVGHTSSDGDRNLELSRERAEVVLAELVALGVPESQLTAVGLGSAYPILRDDGREDLLRSRRVEFAVASA
jgi:outer membrane protein OmpA-like peptidoglycan-associated protein